MAGKVIIWSVRKSLYANIFFDENFLDKKKRNTVVSVTVRHNLPATRSLCMANPGLYRSMGGSYLKNIVTGHCLTYCTMQSNTCNYTILGLAHLYTHSLLYSTVQYSKYSKHTLFALSHLLISHLGLVH